MIEPLRVKSIIRTCYACPSQWEGETEDGRKVYVRYRHGLLSVGLGATMDEAVDDSPGWFESVLTDEDDGFMRWADVEKLANVTVLGGPSRRELFAREASMAVDQRRFDDGLELLSLPDGSDITKSTT